MPKQVIYKNSALECIEDTMSNTYILKIQYQPVLQTQSMFKELMSFLRQYITIRTSKNKRVSLYFNTMNAHANNYMNIKEITDMINDFVSTSNSDLFACIIFLCVNVSVRITVNSIANLYNNLDIPLKVFNSEEDADGFLYEQILNQ